MRKSGWQVTLSSRLRIRFLGWKIIRNTADLIACGSSMEDYEILVSEPIDILAEWRCFIMYDRIIDVRPYGSVSDLNYQGLSLPLWRGIFRCADDRIQKMARPSSCLQHRYLLLQRRTEPDGWSEWRLRARMLRHAKLALRKVHFREMEPNFRAGRRVPFLIDFDEESKLLFAVIT